MMIVTRNARPLILTSLSRKLLSGENRDELEVRTGGGEDGEDGGGDHPDDGQSGPEQGGGGPDRS